MSKAGDAGAASDQQQPAPRKGGVLSIGLIVTGVLLLLVTGSVIAAGPAGYRLGTIGLETATTGVAETAFVAAIITALASGVGLLLCVIQRRPRGAIVGVLVLTAAAMVGFRAWSFQIDRENLPPIHDVQTDWDRPVAFSEITLNARAAMDAVRIRDDARIPEGYGRWSGMGFAAAQSVVYELEPLRVNAPPAEATVAVADAARRLGWNVMLSDPPGGQVEATSYSFWYGLGADVAVRVTPEGEGARIDVRSVNRIAGPDMGANARRIKALLDEVAFALRGE